MTETAVGIGVLGFGGFAMFAAQQFAQVPRVVLRAIAGTHCEVADQLAFVAEPAHRRVVTEENGRESLRMSVRATELAASVA